MLAPHALDIADNYVIIVSLSFTFVDIYFYLRQVKLRIGQRNRKQKSRSKGKIDRRSECVNSLVYSTPILHSFARSCDKVSFFIISVSFLSAYLQRKSGLIKTPVKD